MTRRIRLWVRQSLAYREGKCTNASWGVGYWDSHPKLDADQAFRCVATRPTEAEAVEAAKDIASKQKQYFYEE